MQTEISMSRWKMAFYFGVCLSIFLFALSLLQNPERDAWKRQLVLAFFGLGAIVAIRMLIRPLRLLLDDEGFTLLGGYVWSPKKTSWRDIDDFFVYRVRRGGKMIGYNYRPEARPVSPLLRLSRLTGADGALPGGWVRSPEQVVDELNAYRLRALGGG